MPRAGAPRSKPSPCRRRNSSKTTRATSRSSPTVKVERINLTESRNCQNVGALPGSMSNFKSLMYFLAQLAAKMATGHGCRYNPHPNSLRASCLSKHAAFPRIHTIYKIICIYIYTIDSYSPFQFSGSPFITILET